MKREMINAQITLKNSLEQVF